MSTGKINHLLSENSWSRLPFVPLAGEPMRLRILQAVCRQPHTVNEIVTAVGATRQCFQAPRLAGRAASWTPKEGQRVFYGMKDQLALKLCELVHKHLSPGTPISSAPFRKLPYQYRAAPVVARLYIHGIHALRMVNSDLYELDPQNRSCLHSESFPIERPDQGVLQ